MTDARREPLSTEQIIDLESGGQCAVNVARTLADRLAEVERDGEAANASLYRIIDNLQSELADAQATIADMTARKDAAFLERNQVVAALAKCFPSGVARTAIEGWSEDWHGCVYIDLPTGQVSWHYHDSQAHLFKDLSPYTKSWDGHTTEEKYSRLANLLPQEQQDGKEEAGTGSTRDSRSRTLEK